jgi:dTDP-4-dehydrorhamnose reductase
MKFLVTGSAGLVGSQVVKDLIKSNHQVYSVYHENPPVEGIPIQMDLKNPQQIKQVIQKIKPQKIIHLAAMTNVDLCETNQEEAILLNENSTKTIAIQAAATHAFLLYLSTDYVFGGETGFYKETDSPNPKGFYGKTKLGGELVLKNMASNWSIARTSTPFGIHSKKKNFPIWVKENLELKKSINVVDDQFTSPTYVPNLSKMLIEVSTREINGIIHLAGASRISRYEFSKLIAQKLNLDDSLLKPTKLNQMTWTAPRPKDSSLDISWASEILNEKPQIIQQSLDQFISEI